MLKMGDRQRYSIGYDRYRRDDACPGGKKTWAKSSSMSYDEVNKIIADADADIKRLYHTVEVTISEADIK